MSDNKQLRLPEIKNKWEKREEGSDVNLNKQVHSGDVHDLLTSRMSKPVYGCTLPEIVNGQRMKQHTGNTMNAGSGELVPAHFPPLPVQAVSQQQVKKLSKRSSASSLRVDSQHPQQELPMFPADCINKEGSQLKRDPLVMPARLLSIETQSSSSSSWSAGHEPETSVFRPNAELNNLCKLPEIKNAPVKCSRPKSGTPQRASRVLPTIIERKDDSKNLELPPVPNMQRAESPRVEKAKKKKGM